MLILIWFTNGPRLIEQKRTTDVRIAAPFFTSYVYFLLWRNRKFTFEDTDLGHEDHRSENEDEQRLAMLTKELAKAKQRQTSIIDTMHDQMNILLDVAAKVGVETRYSGDVHDVPRDANH